MNVAVIGVGGVGGYFGGKIARLASEHNELDVTFFARGKHLEAIQQHGLLLSTQNEGECVVTPTRATNDVNDIPMLDVCLICVKSYDLMNVLRIIKSRIDRNTHLIPLLNGVDIYDRVISVVPDAITHPACVYVGTHIERCGKVTQNGGACAITFGGDPRRADADSQAVLDLFKASGIKHKVVERPAEEIWGKYVFIAAFGMVTASEGVSLGQVLDNPERSDRVRAIMQEISEIATRMGVELSTDVVDESFNKGKNFPYQTKTSFQRDFELSDKPNESELFGDTIIRLGHMCGVGTPVTLHVNDKLKRLKGTTL